MPVDAAELQTGIEATIKDRRIQLLVHISQMYSNHDHAYSAID